jgi:hypothetical protein
MLDQSTASSSKSAGRTSSSSSNKLAGSVLLLWQGALDAVCCSIAFETVLTATQCHQWLHNSLRQQLRLPGGVIATAVAAATAVLTQLERKKVEQRWHIASNISRSRRGPIRSHVGAQRLQQRPVAAA